MTISLYQSLKTLPKELDDLALTFKMSAWQRFWRIEMPYALPSLLWNMMISLSGGWFFIVASEAIAFSQHTILLPGIGAYIHQAVLNSNLSAILYAIGTMFIVILGYDQLCFRPLLSWAERFKMEPQISSTQEAPLHHNTSTRSSLGWTVISYGLLITVGACSLLSPDIRTEIGPVLLLGAITGIKVFVLVVFASLIWVPIGVWMGNRPKLHPIFQPIAQFLAAFPVNLLYPFMVAGILHFQLNITLWTTPFMILGTQWYILFNVVAGTIAIPTELRLVTQSFHVQGWLKWKRLIIPAIFPYYITGAMTAAAGCWNASIIAEVMQWGDTQLDAVGLGAYISHQASIGDMPKLTLGIVIMCGYVIVINRCVWHRLYHIAAQRNT
jgi:NitT/TauT family transport system permease protein